MHQNKVVIVTGAFGALGQSVARTLAAQGAKLALLDAAAAVPDALKQAFQAHLVLSGIDLSRDETTAAAVSRVVSQFGHVDALVNIAGGFAWETVEAGHVATWERMFAMNLKTALHACRAVLPHLIAKGAGRIVNIGAAGAARAGAGMGAYAASKSGVLRLTEALSEETKDRGLTVNAILPGIIDTATNRKDMPDADHTRWVAPEAIADVVSFLLSDAARAVTGAGIPVMGRL